RRSWPSITSRSRSSSGSARSTTGSRSTSSARSPSPSCASARASREHPRMNDEEPFLKRWSRRKIEAKDGPDAADPKPAADADARALDDRSSPEKPPAAPGDERQEK